MYIEFEDSIWYIEDIIIADSRAKYYAEVDSSRGDGEYKEIYDEEIEIGMKDSYELIDWASNSMNWSDIEKHAIKTKDKALVVNYEKEYGNARKWCK